MASTSRVSRVGVAGALPPRALVLPSFREARPSAHARDKPSVSLLAGTLRLLRDVAMRARREAEAARARNEPSGDTGAHDTELFATHRGKTLHLPSRILEAATYVRTHGTEASAEDAASRGITAGCLSSVALSLLGDLEDVLLTSKLHVSFLAAIEIEDYRTRLYVLRLLLLDRLPSDRLAATRHLVEVLAAMRSDAAKAAKAAADGEGERRGRATSPVHLRHRPSNPRPEALPPKGRTQTRPGEYRPLPGGGRRERRGARRRRANPGHTQTPRARARLPLQGVRHVGGGGRREEETRHISRTPPRRQHPAQSRSARRSARRCGPSISRGPPRQQRPGRSRRCGHRARASRTFRGVA